MWSLYPQLNPLQSLSINPQTPNFGRINQFTFSSLSPPHTHQRQPSLNPSQQSILLSDSNEPTISSNSKRDKERLSLNSIRAPLKQKKNLQVISSWGKQEMINELVQEKKVMGMKLQRSQQENKRLIARLEQKSKEFEIIKAQLSALKQTLTHQNKLTVKEPNIPSRIDVISNKQVNRSSSSMFHSKRSSGEFQRQEFGGIGSAGSGRENHYSHQKMFKDRLERVCKRLEVLEEEQTLIRYKNKINERNSPYR